jgi:hypothetical protein
VSDEHMREHCGCDKCKAWRHWRDAPCYGCGAVGQHPTYGLHYWPCGTMKAGSIRGELCYEREIAFLRALLGTFGVDEDVPVKAAFNG